MTAAPVVSNASALIALHQIGRLDLLRLLFTTVAVPPAVAREIAPSLATRPSWIVERPLTRRLDPRVLRASLDPGEHEAIGLALELGASWVVLDDLSARRVAEDAGLPVVGVLGLLVRAKQRAQLTDVRTGLDALVDIGFFVGPDVYRQVLADAGEVV